MEVVDFEFLSQSKFGETFVDFLKLRKRHFVDQLCWQIPHNREVEFDQYDRPESYYIIVKKNDIVVGGARAMKLDATWGHQKTMLLDAVDGVIPGMRLDLTIESHEKNTLWEGTRLVISNDLSGEDKKECMKLIVRQLLHVVKREGGSGLVTVSPPVLQRYMRHFGFYVTCLGSDFLCAEDNRKYTVLKLDLDDQIFGGKLAA